MATRAVGFRNLGTSCFLNAGLQALFGVRDLVKSIADGGTTDEVALQRLLARMADTHQVVVPAEITNRYYHGRQEDITEFLGKILEKCVGCHEFLCGKERSSFQCQHCGYRRSLQVENFQTIQLPILDMNSVQEALNAYLSRTTITDDAQDWCCLTTNCLDNALAEDSPLHVSCIESWPKVLVLSLKRWTGHDAVLAHKVFIDKVLTTETCTYDLCSLATHIGPRPESGHYMAYRRDAFGFVKLDDHNVAEVLPAQEDYFVTVPAEKVYVLFYVKRGDIVQDDTGARTTKFRRMTSSIEAASKEGAPRQSIDLEKEDSLKIPSEQPRRKSSFLAKLEKSKIIWNTTVSLKNEPMDLEDTSTAAVHASTDVESPGKKQTLESNLGSTKQKTAAKTRTTSRGIFLRDLWRPHDGHGSCRNAACVFGFLGGIAPAGPSGFCDLCDFEGMETLLHHGRGRLTHLLTQLAEPEAEIALARISSNLGESFADELRGRMQRSLKRKQPDRPRRGPRGPYMKHKATA